MLVACQGAWETLFIVMSPAIGAVAGGLAVRLARRS